MDAKLFQMLLAHPKTLRLYDFEWENAYSPVTGERFQLVFLIDAAGQSTFKLKRSSDNTDSVLEDVSQQQAAAALLAGKPWITTIIKSKANACLVVESQKDKAERFILESVSFGSATLSVTYERVLREGVENEEFRLLLRTPSSRPKQRDFPLSATAVAEAIAQGESILSAALRMWPEAEEAFLSEDAEFFSIAEASKLRQSSRNSSPKRGRSTL